ncbi:MAG: MFS transporter [Casimicrobiaceae bacterium]
MHLFSLPDFRRLWFIGFTLSVVRWLEMLALALFAYKLTGSAFVVAMLTMLRLLPMALFGAFVGAAAERFDRRRVLALVVAISTTASLTLAILASLDAIAVWHLAVASFVSGLAWVADNPVRRMLIGDTVGVDRIGSALSIDTATNNGTRILGPALSGLLLAKFGIAGVFWFSVALFLPCLVAANRIGMRRAKSATQPPAFVASIREGLGWLRRDGRLTGVFAITIIFNIFGWPATSMVPVIGTNHLGLGPQGVGLLAACDGVGGLLGALFIARLAPAGWYGRIYAGAVGLYFVMVVCFAAAPVISLAAASLFLSGTFQAVFAVMQTILVYRSAPAAMRARLLGVLSVCIGTGPIGFLYLGFLTEMFAPRTATMALAAQGMIVLLLTRRFWVGTLRL